MVFYEIYSKIKIFLGHLENARARKIEWRWIFWKVSTERDSEREAKETPKESSSSDDSEDSGPPQILKKRTDKPASREILSADVAREEVESLLNEPFHNSNLNLI